MTQINNIDVAKELVTHHVRGIVKKHMTANLDIAEIRTLKKAERGLLASRDINQFQTSLSSIKPTDEARIKQEASTLKILFAIDAKLTKKPALSLREQTKLNSLAQAKKELTTDQYTLLADIANKPKTYKDCELTTPKALEKKYEHEFSHKVSIVTKPEKESRWIYKNTPEGEAHARREVLAQEFLRFLMDWYPKTRLHKSGTAIGVLSKFIQDDHQALRESIRTKPEEFAQTCILALAVGESDLRVENLRIDKGKVVKIDGGLCFAKLKFTEKDIALSPFIADVTPNNYFDLVKHNGDKTITKLRKSAYFGASLSNNEKYRAGVHYALLKLLVLTDEVLQEFVEHYIETAEEQKQFSQALINTRDMFQQAAYKDANFVAYLQKSDAMADFNQFLMDIRCFKTMRKDLFWHHLTEQEQNQLTIRFDQLVADTNKLAEPLSATLSTVSSIDTIVTTGSSPIGPSSLFGRPRIMDIDSASDEESDTLFLKQKVMRPLDCDYSSPRNSH